MAVFIAVPKTTRNQALHTFHEPQNFINFSKKGKIINSGFFYNPDPSPAWGHPHQPEMASFEWNFLSFLLIFFFLF